jgi:hypothetical protein
MYLESKITTIFMKYIISNLASEIKLLHIHDKVRMSVIPGLTNCYALTLHLVAMVRHYGRFEFIYPSNLLLFNIYTTYLVDFHRSALETEITFLYFQSVFQLRTINALAEVHSINLQAEKLIWEMIFVTCLCFLNTNLIYKVLKSRCSILFNRVWETELQ